MGEIVRILTGMLAGQCATVVRVIDKRDNATVDIEVTLEIAGKEARVRYPPEALQLVDAGEGIDTLRSER